MLKSSTKEFLDLKSPLSLVREMRDNNYNQFSFSNIQNFGIDPNSNNTIEELDMKWAKWTIEDLRFKIFGKAKYYGDKDQSGIPMS